MKTDFYTKTILTVIALALVVIAFNNTKIVNEAKAESVNFNKPKPTEPLHVIIDEVEMHAFMYCTVPVKIDD